MSLERTFSSYGSPGTEFEGTPYLGFMPEAAESPGGGRIHDKRDPRPADLVEVAGANRRVVPLHRLAAAAWRAMVAAARAAGLAAPLLLPVSGYRSREHQARLFDAAVRRYGSRRAASRWVAPPGGSAHQSGRAIDLYLGGENSSANAHRLRDLPAHRWLAANAGRFGFYPYSAEPWHWEYNPRAAHSARAARPGAAVQATPGSRRRADVARARTAAGAGAGAAAAQALRGAVGDVRLDWIDDPRKRHLERGVMVRGIAPKTTPPCDLAGFVRSVTSSSEGTFDSVNIYDWGIVSWGLLQWTASSGNLQALIRFIRDRRPDVYEQVFRSQGFEVDGTTFVYRGQRYGRGRGSDRTSLRMLFRGHTARGQYDRATIARWARFFALAGRHLTVQALQNEFANQQLLRRMHAGSPVGTPHQLLGGDWIALAVYAGQGNFAPAWVRSDLIAAAHRAGGRGAPPQRVFQEWMSTMARARHSPTTDVNAQYHHRARTLLALAQRRRAGHCPQAPSPFAADYRPGTRAGQ